MNAPQNLFLDLLLERMRNLPPLPLGVYTPYVECATLSSFIFMLLTPLQSNLYVIGTNDAPSIFLPRSKGSPGTVKRS